MALSIKRRALIYDKHDPFRVQASGKLLQLEFAAPVFRGYAAQIHDDRIGAAHQFHYGCLPCVVAAAEFVDAITPVRIRFPIQSRKPLV